jgi:hypothetical protein
MACLVSAVWPTYKYGDYTYGSYSWAIGQSEVAAILCLKNELPAYFLELALVIMAKNGVYSLLVMELRSPASGDRCTDRSATQSALNNV